MKKVFLISIILFLIAGPVFAHQPRIVKDEVVITDPEISRAFYSELKGEPEKYIIKSDKDFLLYLNLLVPKNTNPEGRYSLYVFDEKEDKVGEILSSSEEWEEFYEEFGRDYYLMGPELEKEMPAGTYTIEVYSKDNLGKYVLAVGKIENFSFGEIVNALWLVPQLKMGFFGSSPWGFLLSPFAIIPLFILIVLAVVVILIIKKYKKKKNKN